MSSRQRYEEGSSGMEEAAIYIAFGFFAGLLLFGAAVNQFRDKHFLTALICVSCGALFWYRVYDDVRIETKKTREKNNNTP